VESFNYVGSVIANNAKRTRDINLLKPNDIYIYIYVVPQR